MTKSELANKIASKIGINTALAQDMIDVAISEIKEAVKAGDDVTLRGFGTFKSVHKAAKAARNISTGEPIIVAEHNEPVFKASKEFKQEVK